MRKIARVAVTTVVSAGLGLGGATAGAAVHRENERFCQALSSLGSQYTQGATEITADSARPIAKALRKAAKSTPRRVKKALRRLARFYDGIADGDSAAEVFANEQFVKDSVTYSTYFIQQCANITVPTPEP